MNGAFGGRSAAALGNSDFRADEISEYRAPPPPIEYFMRRRTFSSNIDEK